MLKILPILILSLLFSACSYLPTNDSSLTPLSLEYSEPNRIRFEGKGAGAGIALMSTMGPVGIALGVAIDEGIAKNIQEAVDKEQADVVGLLTKTIDQKIHNYNRKVATQEQSTEERLVVKRYGFKTIPGGDDLVVPVWHIALYSGEELIKEVKYPFDTDTSAIDSMPLQTLKIDGKQSVRLLLESLNTSLDELISH